jgi:hypothetical protein
VDDDDAVGFLLSIVLFPFFCLLSGLYKPGGYFGKKALKCVQPGFWAVFGSIEGFGLKPWFWEF